MPSNYAESAEQIELFKSLCKIPWGKLTLRRYCFAIPNAGTRGGRRGAIQGARRVAEGLTSGVADIMCAIPWEGHHGLFIEMKREDGVPSDVSKNQREWLALMTEQGYETYVAYGAADALKKILNYLNLDGSSRQ